MRNEVRLACKELKSIILTIFDAKEYHGNNFSLLDPKISLFAIF